VSVGLLSILGLEPVRQLSGLGGDASILALDLDSHGLVLLEVAGEVGLLGGLGGLGGDEGLDLAFGVGLLYRRDLVGLELLEVKLLNKVGSPRDGGSNEAPRLDGSTSSSDGGDGGASALHERESQRPQGMQWAKG
jgi:hypothetical protein